MGFTIFWQCIKFVKGRVLFFESQSSGIFTLVASSTMRLNGDLGSLPRCHHTQQKGKDSKDNVNLKGKLKHTHCKQKVYSSHSDKYGLGNHIF